MRLLVRALIVAALSSLVLTGVAIAAAGEVEAKDGHTEMEFLAQYERLGEHETAETIRTSQEQVVDWFIAEALMPPTDALIANATERQMRESMRVDGSLPASYFQPPPTWFYAAGYGSGGAVANMYGSPVDVIVG